MANISTHTLVAAVSNAGGLGVLATGFNEPDWVRDEIRKIKQLTDKPFGVNLYMFSPHIKELAKLVVEEGVKILTTGAGNPQPYMKEWKDAGIKVIDVYKRQTLLVHQSQI